MAAPIAVALIAGLAVGALAQKTRLCMVGGIRDAILFQDFHLLLGFVAIFAAALAANLVLGNPVNFSFAGQPVAHTDGVWNFLGMLLVGLAAVLLGGCAQRTAEPASGQIFAMDTIMSMDVYGEGGEEALARAEETIYRLEDLWAVTDENSEIWALNHSGGAWVDLSQETADLLSRALELCALTDGALDLTAYSAVQAWGFTTGEYRVPSQEELDALTPRIDYTRLELDGDGLRARLPENMELDLGAVAKGYTGTYLAEQLRQAGVTSAILRLGGNIQAVGTRPDGNPWRVAIQDPDSQQEATLGVVEIADQAVITSGGYQRYFEEGGETYWHIMDPDTAAPARSGLTSVTVIGADGTVCDALSTALFVMGPEEAAAFWRAHPELGWS